MGLAFLSDGSHLLFEEWIDSDSTVPEAHRVLYSSGHGMHMNTIREDRRSPGLIRGKRTACL